MKILNIETKENTVIIQATTKSGKEQQIDFTIEELYHVYQARKAREEFFDTCER